MSEELPFDPLPFMEDPHRQTIVGSFFTFISEPLSEQRLVKLSDGDRISLEITTPSDWKPENLTVFLVHGLCGSHKSPNLVRMAKRLERLGVRTVRFNMRSCGSGKGHAKRMYHAGRSDDILECLKVLKIEQPQSPIVLIGFSLGANLVLKLAGELGNFADAFLERVIAVSPPLDLYQSVQMIGEPVNSLYENYFYKLLRNEVRYLQRKFKDLPKIHLPKGLKIYEFDQIYTAPASGFSNAQDYYQKCSASNLVTEIAIPCNILLAEDDPIISPHTVDRYKLPSNVNVFKTKKGGHLGYLGRAEGKPGIYWLDSLLIDWILES